ncbi:MAG: hypothetical protein JXA13_15845 [Anaerolineales bacterium]|nr:hypothetical protein [Anaerolineales bacterium]
MTTIPAELIKKTIIYYYMLAYSTPTNLENFKGSLASYRENLVASSGMKEKDFYREAIPDVCRRIVAFHEDNRDPSRGWVEALTDAARSAEKSPQEAYEYQQVMTKVARLPQRALPDNRLHRKKGCAFCKLPCHYGFFTLVSDPEFSTLQELLDAEVNREKETQSAIRPVWGFALSHLSQTTGLTKGYSIHKVHLGNLSYCLLMLAMAKSRLAVPERQLKVFQDINQQLISNASASVK